MKEFIIAVTKARNKIPNKSVATGRKKSTGL